jgi:hypothetical protein
MGSHFLSVVPPSNIRSCPRPLRASMGERWKSPAPSYSPVIDQTSRVVASTARHADNLTTCPLAGKSNPVPFDFPQMRYSLPLEVVARLVLALAGASCDTDNSASLRRQENTTLTFYGKAVDESGMPLEGVRFSVRIEAYPKDWTFDTRGRPNDVSTVTIVTDGTGCFELPVTGCQLICHEMVLHGYRPLFDTDAGDGAVQNRYYRFISWGELLYKSDPNNPAVFVLVREGIREVTALPSRGGMRRAGKHWVDNGPAWPRKPSLEDVVQRPPASRP